MKFTVIHKACLLAGIAAALFIPVAVAANLQLLVGTTGDYPPLTAKSGNGFSGKDIDIVKAFAKDNQFELKFVPTTWQTLNSDLSQNKFVIAVGGISVNPERSKLFYLSLPIESSTKAAMIRCADMNRFTSLPEIDNESIVIIENRGGTNQDFALKNIISATIKLVPANATAIASLTTTPPLADVMFTDDIEIAYRHQLNPKLCQAQIPEKFSSSSKVFVFAKTAEGQKLQQLFNQWWQSKLNQR